MLIKQENSAVPGAIHVLFPLWRVEMGLSAISRPFVSGPSTSPKYYYLISSGRQDIVKKNQKC